MMEKSTLRMNMVTDKFIKDECIAKRIWLPVSSTDFATRRQDPWRTVRASVASLFSGLRDAPLRSHPCELGADKEHLRRVVHPDEDDRH
jgi:hypothetical protein